MLTEEWLLYYKNLKKLKNNWQDTILQHLFVYYSLASQKYRRKREMPRW